MYWTKERSSLSWDKQKESEKKKKKKKKTKQNKNKLKKKKKRKLKWKSREAWHILLLSGTFLQSLVERKIIFLSELWRPETKYSIYLA